MLCFFVVAVGCVVGVVVGVVMDAGVGVDVDGAGDVTGVVVGCVASGRACCVGVDVTDGCAVDIVVNVCAVDVYVIAGVREVTGGGCGACGVNGAVEVGGHGGDVFVVECWRGVVGDVVVGVGGWCVDGGVAVIVVVVGGDDVGVVAMRVGVSRSVGVGVVDDADVGVAAGVGRMGSVVVLCVRCRL